MTGTDDLRAALADTDTPAGIDVTAVRDRARRARRRRLAVATSATAVAAALAVALPTALLAPDRPTAPGTTASAGPPLACPDTLPDRPSNAGPDLADALVPFTPDAALICSYVSVDPSTNPGPLTGVARLTAAETLAAVRRLDAAPVAGGQFVCTSEFGWPFVLRVAGPGRAATLRLEPYGCGLVGNGTLTRAADADKAYLRDLAARAEGTSSCPASVREPNGLFSAEPGTTLLPTDTRRLLLCAYYDDVRRRGKAAWDAVIDRPQSGILVRELNNSPAASERCTAEDVGPKVLIVAVAPDRVKRVLASLGGCRRLFDGVRARSNGARVQELYDQARR